MWIMLNDCFFSIVRKDCARDELLVRARRPGDIEKVFPDAKVEMGTRSDYAYRARVKVSEVQAAMHGEIARINYSNFKDSVSKDDEPLHDAYMAVWMAMSKLQPTAPYSGFARPIDDNFVLTKASEIRSERARHAANVRWGNAKLKKGR